MERRGLVADLEAKVNELATPTATEPVPATREVICVHCQRRVPLAATDVVGLGYRCDGCSDRAGLAEMSGEPDVADHLVIADRARFAAEGRRLAIRALLVFAFLVAVAIAILIVAPSTIAFKILLSAVFLILIAGGHGYARWRRFRVR